MEKALKISTDACKRLKKELAAYTEEARIQEQVRCPRACVCRSLACVSAWLACETVVRMPMSCGSRRQCWPRRGACCLTSTSGAAALCCRPRPPPDGVCRLAQALNKLRAQLAEVDADEAADDIKLSAAYTNARDVIASV